MLGGDSNRAIGTANDGAWMVEEIGVAEVDDESCVLGTGHEGYAGANFNAERLLDLASGMLGVAVQPAASRAKALIRSLRTKFRPNHLVVCMHSLTVPL